MGWRRAPDLSPLATIAVELSRDRVLDLKALRKSANTVTTQKVRLLGEVGQDFAGDLLFSHRAMEATLASERLRIGKGGRFDVRVSLLRGRNTLAFEAAGGAAGTFVLDLFYRTTLGEWIDSILRALVLVLVVKTYVVQAFYIPTPSMEKTLLGHAGTHDYILVEKVSYLFGSPRQGEIIVFQYPVDPSKDFIKRMVGGEGDLLEVRDRALIHNGRRLFEPYTQWLKGGYRLFEDGLGAYGPRRVPGGHVFVMGDNRDNSRDSRAWGALPRWRVIGKAWGIYWPIPRLRLLDHRFGTPEEGPAPPPPSPAPSDG